ncbi:MAG: tRNA (adenosine(37)-N6)-dimethylallyltransferase MiaA [Muribaculaceae bacterium]|nr:tRNA (adenosine(37)-N6)-dimethylallyltransferase MiaA [Muribaculaceae bacterium]
MVEKPQQKNKQTKLKKEGRIVTILGPTACGKTRRAVTLAKALDGEIISADSRQVYREMNLGTGKDLEEYDDVRYHLIDICEAGNKYNLHNYLRDFHNALENIIQRGKRPIICGGSGMYLENALSGIRLPEVEPNLELRHRLSNFSLEELTQILKGYKTLHNTTDIDTPKRAIRAIEIEEYYQVHPEEALLSNRKNAAPLDSLIIGLDIPLEQRREKISRRLEKRLEEGMVEEVENLLSSGINPEDLIYYGLEFKYLTLYVIGELSFDEMRKKLEIAIHQFAKRQMTWFRGMERRGFKIHWLPFDLSEEDFLKRVLNLLYIN